MLQEALELFDRAIRRGQEGARVVRAGLDPLDIVELCDEVAAEALDAALDLHCVARLKAKAQTVRLAEHARRQGAAAIP